MISPSVRETPPLLTTKLFIPPPTAQLVPRARLADRLDAALRQGHQLTLVLAAAGFGKTTCLSEWLHGGDCPPAAWLSLDADDNELDRFLAYVVAALETVWPTVGESARAVWPGGGNSPPLRTVLTRLINVIAEQPERGVLVLDDYHTIAEATVHAAVAFLLEHLPPQLHLILTTRTEPPLPLARLRARNRLTEIRADDLRFTHDEVAGYLGCVPGLDLPTEAIRALETRTEGWITGLQLAALSLQGQDTRQTASFLAEFSGTHRYVLDYLANEVFQRQPEAVQRFLLQTAVLPRLTGSLCEAVTGQPRGQAALEALEQANLFLIPLDGQRRWYRYHHLFADFLQGRLEREIATAGLAALRARASAWFEAQGLLGEAIDQALAAHDWARAQRLMGALMGEVPFTSNAQVARLSTPEWAWERWLTALPEAALQAAPDLALRAAWILFLTGRSAASERCLRQVERSRQRTGDGDLLGEALALRAFNANVQGDAARGLARAQQALAALPAHAVAARRRAFVALGDACQRLGRVREAAEAFEAARPGRPEAEQDFMGLSASHFLGWAYLQAGQLRRADALLRDTLRQLGDAPEQQIPMPHLFRGLLVYEWNDLATAADHARRGLDSARRSGLERYWSLLPILQARVLWAQGELAQAQAVLDQAAAFAKELSDSRFLADVQAYQARLWLSEGDLPAATRWLASHHLSLRDPLRYEHQAEVLTGVRIVLTQARSNPESPDLGQVGQLLERLSAAAEDAGRFGDVIEMLGLQALTRHVQRDVGRAVERLCRALSLAEPEGYVRTFLDEGAPMAALLALVAARGRGGDYARRLLAASGRALEPALTPSPATVLSDREQDVLRLLAGGHTAEEIAAALIISAHTTRTHIKRIYTKLDAHNRVQVVERARALRLL